MKLLIIQKKDSINTIFFIALFFYLIYNVNIKINEVYLNGNKIEIF